MIRRASLIAFAVAAFAWAAACNVNTVARVVDGADERTFGPNEAIGAVNYQPNDSAYWDRHITSCRADQSGALVFSAGGSDPVLKLDAAAETPYAVVYSAKGPIRFEKSQCETFLVRVPDGRQAGSETLICKRGAERLNTTIRFGPCSR